jgi:hypothetical protein
MIGLAQDGKADPKGMPNLLQLAVTATEFDDVIHFLNPPRFMQRVLFPILAPIARLHGYRGSYSEYIFRLPSERVRKAAASQAARDVTVLSECEVRHGENESSA